MNYVKIRDVTSPNRGTEGSAGIDFYIPNDYPGVEYLATNESTVVKSGIHVKVPKGHALIVMNKSGVAIKKGLQVGACVVDEDYQGELHLHVINIGDEFVELHPGEKLVQMLIVPINMSEPKELQYLEDLYPEKTARGRGTMGSTGTK